MSLRRALIVASVLGAAGCAALLGVEGVDYGGAADSGGDDVRAEAGGADAPPVPDAGDDRDEDASDAIDAPTDAPLTCPDGGKPITETAIDNADNTIGESPPTLHQTPTTIVVVQNQLVTLARFPLTPAAGAAVSSDRVVMAVATFTRAIMDTLHCGAAPAKCQAIPGQFAAYALKKKWNVNAVTWNESDTGMSWAGAGAQGGADIGPEAWHAFVNASDAEMSVMLDPKALDIGVQSDGSLSLRLSSTDGAFVIAALMNTTYAHPKLALSYCP